MAIEVLSKVYKPSMTVGQVYAKSYGTADALTPIGNVLQLSLDHTEDVQKQDDMTHMGGGTYAEVRRVTAVTMKMQIADINMVNLARATQATLTGVQTGTAADEPFTVSALGTLLPLMHIDPTSVVVKKGPDKATASPVAMDGNYTVMPEGIVLLSGAPGIAPADQLWVSYSYGDYAVIEAITTKASELQLLFGGLNEADSGKPMVVDIWRCSQGVTKSLALINGKGFGALDVEGTLLQDPTKTGVGVSKFYRARAR